MNTKRTLNSFHTNYMQMYNLLRECETGFAEGDKRQEAYNLPLGWNWSHHRCHFRIRQAQGCRAQPVVHRPAEAAVKHGVVYLGPWSFGTSCPARANAQTKEKIHRIQNITWLLPRWKHVARQFTLSLHRG